MAAYVHFTDEQKIRANAVDLVDFLQRQGEQLVRSGREWRWKRHDSVTVRGNQWFRHSARQGSYAIDFVREFYGMSFPDAVSFLLGGEQGMDWRQHDESKAKQEKKAFLLPEAHTDMRRVYAYLMKKRFIDRDVISHFAHVKTLYEDSKYHNAVFVGTDENGVARHAHKKGTYSDGDSFRANVTGSQPQYSFRHVGAGNTLHVFEAPIDLLSFLTLYPKDWKEQSYVTLDGVSEHAMLYVLEQNPQITKVRLCLDHDAAGIEAAGRLVDILRERGYTDIAVYAPHFKDWNEDVKARNGVTPIPAQEHPKIVACGELLDELADICGESDAKAASWDTILADYTKIASLTQMGRQLAPNQAAAVSERLQSMAASALLQVMADCRQMERPVTVEQLMNRLRREYAPHNDRDKFRSKIESIQQTVNGLGGRLHASGIRTLDDRQKIISDTMSLALQCVKAQIFIQTEFQNQLQAQGEAPCQEEHAAMIMA